MVRVSLKGGIWKNSEDEILKAAVQKYGKQQWARVASLLNRKTAKQAKARWHEWLDPAIKKTEWSRQEEEKLLHLAKLMPAQWKTIAPLVGRTATQCQEHYEYLLDQAASAASGGDAAAGDDDEQQQLRKQTLQPGQIDPHPETKPARPDPIDMDEDELEMLQEARARLANTQGKKAKRKQREKMLLQAKRLADLQKRRELKQAGLLSSAMLKKTRRRKEIDLGVEIPFHKPAPAGFHDTAGEVARTNAIREKRLKDVDYHKVNENQYRSRDRELSQAKKREEARLRILEQSNEKYKKQKEEEDQIASRPRGTLSLPAPTVTDAELAMLQKAQQQEQMDALEIGDGVTGVLMGDYSDRPLPTPMRTPAVGGGGRNLALEASQLRQLERGQTPLLVRAGEDDKEDFESTTDIHAATTTTTTSSGSIQPIRSSVGRTPLAVRDEFNLNRPATDLRDGAGAGGDAASVGASTFASSRYSIRELARQERRAAKRARMELEAALAALPAPMYEYELAVPENLRDLDEQHGRVETVEMDQADLEAAELERERVEAQKLYDARSSVLKRNDLPRPSIIVPGKSIITDENDVNNLILQEMTMMLQHDAFNSPVIVKKDSKKTKKRKQASVESKGVPKVHLEQLSEASLSEARALVDAEFKQLVDSKIAEALSNNLASTSSRALDLLVNETCESIKAGTETLVYVNGEWIESNAPDDMISSLKYEFFALREATEHMKSKNDKLESKVGLLTGGYRKRANKLSDETLQAFAQLQNSKIEEMVYESLKRQEDLGAAARIERTKQDISSLKSEHAKLQRVYGDLLVERRRLQVSVNKPK